MEVDKTVVTVGVILLAVLGIFAFSQLGSSGSSGQIISNGVGYAGQVAGGACGA
jgi:hypothetical protein